MTGEEAAGPGTGLLPQNPALAATDHSTKQTLSQEHSGAGSALETLTHTMSFSRRNSVSWHRCRDTPRQHDVKSCSNIHRVDAASNRKALLPAQLALPGEGSSRSPEEQLLISGETQCDAQLGHGGMPRSLLALSSFLVFVRTGDLARARDALEKSEHDVSATGDRDTSQTAALHHSLHAGTCCRSSSHTFGHSHV